MEVTTLQPEQPCLGLCMGRAAGLRGTVTVGRQRENPRKSPCGAEGVKILPGGAALRLSVLEMGPDWGFSPRLQPLVFLAKTFFF